MEKVYDFWPNPFRILFRNSFILKTFFAAFEHFRIDVFNHIHCAILTYWYSHFSSHLVDFNVLDSLIKLLNYELYIGFI